MIENQVSTAIERAFPALSLIPGLSPKFDLRDPSEFLERYFTIQEAGSAPSFAYRSSSGHHISFMHDTPLLSHSQFRGSRYLFPEGVNGFRDQILVDLGAGRSTDGYLLARDLGARAYIGVEFCFAPMLKRNLDELPPQEKTIPYALIYDSIEEVLQALPPASVSFTCAGVDETFPGFKEFRSAISSMLPKALHPQGACLLDSPDLRTFTFPELHNVSMIPTLTVWTR